MKTIINFILSICFLIGGILTTNIPETDPAIGSSIAAAIESITHETVYITEDEIEPISDFKFIASLFDSAEIHTDFRNDTEGYSVESFSLVDTNGCWVVDVIYKQYDTEELAQSYWNEMRGMTEFHMETYASPNDETVNGYESDNTSYWFVDGYLYEMYYSCIEGDTLFEVYAQTISPSVPVSEGEQLQDAVRAILDVFQYEV